MRSAGQGSEPPVPHVVIAGAPKTGTTALAEQLARHPSIFVPATKEPRFLFHGEPRSGPLAREFNEPWTRTIEAYGQLYTTASGRLCVDASTDYLSQPASALRLAERNPMAKVIIGLRHPVARAFSEHVHLLREGAESKDFVGAIRELDEGRRVGWVPLFQHLERSSYSAGLRAYTETFDCFVFHHEDLRANPGSIAAELAAFLQLDSPLEPAQQVNTAGVPRFGALNSIVRPRTPALRAARSVARQALSPERLGRLRSAIDAKNLAAPSPPDRNTVAELIERFEQDIAATEDILGCSLPQWRTYPKEWQ